MWKEGKLTIISWSKQTKTHCMPVAHGRRSVKSHLPTRWEPAARFWSFSWEKESTVVSAYNAKSTRSPREAQPFLILPLEGKKFLLRTEKMLSNVQSHPRSKETAVSPRVLLYERAKGTCLQASVATRAQGLTCGVCCVLALAPRFGGSPHTEHTVPGVALMRTCGDCLLWKHLMS